jgi:O-antigen/teichoic acid export membrane protein
MLERLLEDGKKQAGIYAQSFRILDAASQFAFLFAVLLLPMFSRMLKLNGKVNELIRIALPILMVAALSLAIAGNFFREDIISMLYHQHDINSYKIFGILMIGFVFISISYIFGPLLTANGNLRQLNILAAITVLLNVSLNLILIPKFKGYGAALASLSSQGFYAIAQMFLTSRIIKIPINIDILGKLALFTVINTAIGWLLVSTIENWIIAFFVLVASCVISSVALKLLRLKEILEVLKERDS